MPKIQFLGKKVGVEKASKAETKPKTGLFVEEPEIADDFGTVRFIGQEITNPPFAVGDKVYFGKYREELRMAGKDILVMEESNVLAKVIEAEENSAQ